MGNLSSLDLLVTTHKTKPFKSSELSTVTGMKDMESPKVSGGWHTASGGNGERPLDTKILY